MLNHNEFPTKGNLINTQHTLKLARQGYTLLDQKKNVLIQDLAEAKIQSKILQDKMAETLKTAKKALQYANIEMGSNKVKAVADSIPIDSRDTSDPGPSYNLSDTKLVLDEAQQNFGQVKELIITLSAAESNRRRLEAEIRKTGKRANALLYIIIPKNETRLKFIQDALEERDRDGFVRLKVSKSKT